MKVITDVRKARSTTLRIGIIGAWRPPGTRHRSPADGGAGASLPGHFCARHLFAFGQRRTVPLSSSHSWHPEVVENYALESASETEPELVEQIEELRVLRKPIVASQTSFVRS